MLLSGKQVANLVLPPSTTVLQVKQLLAAGGGVESSNADVPSRSLDGCPSRSTLKPPSQRWRQEERFADGKLSNAAIGTNFVPPRRMQLVVGSRILENTATLSESGLPSPAVLQLVQRSSYRITRGKCAGYDYLFRVLLVGRNHVGKSAMLERLVTDTFQQEYNVTLGVDFRVVPFLVDNATRVRLQVWDTPGLERRYRNITVSYLLGMHGALVVFDVMQRDTFLKVEAHLDDVARHGAVSACVALVGTKADSSSERPREVSESEARSFAAKRGLEYFETSAKNGDVDSPFHGILSMLLDRT